MAVIALTSLASTGFAAAGGTLIAGSFALHFLATAAIGLALNALTPKPKIGGSNRGYDVNSFGSALDHQIIYGQVKVGGAVVYDNATGNNNKFLHRVIAYAGHEVESFEEIYINDELVSTGPAVDYTVVYTYTRASITRSITVTLLGVPDTHPVYNVSDSLTELQFDNLKDAAIKVEDTASVFSNLNTFVSATVSTKKVVSTGILNEKYYDTVRINAHLGSATQAADTDLVSEVAEWTTNHRLRGIAYLYVRLKFDTDVFPNGVPTITAVIKGKKVYDPRSDTTAWSSNPALCMRDYLTTTGYGLGEETASVDDTLVSTAANVCDFFNFPTLTGDPRFTCNGAFTTAVTPYDLLGDLLSCMGGMLWYGQGKWRMKPAYYTAPAISLNEDDLRSSVNLSTRHSRRDNFNTVKGTFKGEETNWQVTDYPEVTNSAFVTEDGGQISVVDIDLPFTSDSVVARRIGRIALERNRQQLTINSAFGLKAFQLQVGDIVQITNARFGWSDKEFEVISWTFGIVDEYDLQVEMTLREISESVFDDISDGIIYSRDNTTLVSPFEVPVVGMEAVARLQVLNEKLTNIITITTTSGAAERIDFVEVQFKLASDTEWKTVGTGELGKFEAIDLEDNLYDFRARAVNTFGVKGDWEFLFNVEAQGLATPPSDITGLAFEVTDGNTFLEWTPVPDLDLSFYRVRHAVETSNATWANSTTAVDKVPRPASSVSLASRSGTYMIRPYDKSGISSEDYSRVVVIPEVLETFTTTLTQTDSPTFSGTKTGCSVNVSNYLKITDPSVAPSEATYTFSDYIDTGAVRRVKARVDAALIRINEAGNTFDSLPGLFDDLTGLFDGLSGDQDFADTNLEFYISTTEDDPAGTPTWTPYAKFRVGNFYGRAFRFQVILKSTADDVTPNITSLSAVVEHN